MSAIWSHKEFVELSLDELYGVLALRQEVFIVEQRCPYADADGLDRAASHLFARDDDGDAAATTRVVACARLFAPGVHQPAAVIGRVVTAPSVRKSGMGKELMARAIDAIERRHGATPIQLGAQQYLERFYAAFGFARAGADYFEDGIRHLPMRRPPTARR